MAPKNKAYQIFLWSSELSNCYGWGSLICFVSQCNQLEQVSKQVSRVIYPAVFVKDEVGS